MRVQTFGPTGGRPLLLLHGGGVAGWMWEPMRGRFDDGRRVIVPDLPGHGGSADRSYVSHAETIAELARILEREEQPATVAGFSLGAQLTVLLAAQHAELVHSIAVISAQAVPIRAPRPALALLGATAGLAKREWFARLQARELFIPGELLGDYLRTSSAITRETLLRSVGENLRFRPPNGWRSFPRRALILVGAREKPLMRRSAAVLHDALEGSVFEVVDGCGHGIPLQRPEWLARRMESWIDRLG